MRHQLAKSASRWHFNAKLWQIGIKDKVGKSQKYILKHIGVTWHCLSPCWWHHTKKKRHFKWHIHLPFYTMVLNSHFFTMRVVQSSWYGPPCWLASGGMTHHFIIYYFVPYDIYDLVDDVKLMESWVVGTWVALTKGVDPLVSVSHLKKTFGWL